MALLANSGIGPDYVGFWPASGGHGAVLVYRFFPGVMWRADSAEAAQLIKRVHAIQAEGFRAMPMSARDLLADADRLPAPPDDEPLWHRLRALRPTDIDGPVLERSCFVHGDFSAGNMIAGTDGVRIIDWQCPGLGDPAEDLWSFLSTAFQAVYGMPFWTDDEIARFRDAYGDTSTLGRLDVLRPYFSYRYVYYSLRRVHDLAADDPAASERYRAATMAGSEDLERA